MLSAEHGLTDAALEAIADLERRVVAHDGGRLKLEWGVLRRRPADQVRDLLWWEDGRLLGFLGIYGFNQNALEVTGMVDPEARRRGIGRSLFDAALPICQAQGRGQLLIVVPRVSEAGHAFALARGTRPDHSEHALTLAAPAALAPAPATGASPDVTLRRATRDDLEALSRLYREGFGAAHADPERLTSSLARTLMIERGGERVGTLATALDGRRGAVYGFIVASHLRGQGIGRAALRRACLDLFQSGAGQVDLEVEVENDRALGLYTSLGFEPYATDDYYALPLAGATVTASRARAG